MHFPSFQHLLIENYHLYPGKNGNSKIDLLISPGPLIVLGTNGLGKSTLLLLLKHLVTGATKMRGAGFAGEKSDIIKLDKRFFADRVGDQARDAHASTKIKLGSSFLTISRRLRDLELIEASFESGDEKQQVTSEEEYRELLAHAMGVAGFEDALRIMDRVIFYLEPRDALLWDLSAQFEIFRAILTQNVSKELRRLESEIVSNDSSARNLNASLSKIDARRKKELARHDNSPVTRAQLAEATAERDALKKAEENLLGEREHWAMRRSDSRVSSKRAEREVDEALHEYERLKFEAYRSAFAGVNPNEQYIFLKLLSDGVCRACGTKVPELVKELEEKQKKNNCLVCGSTRPKAKSLETLSKKLQEKSEKAYALLIAHRKKFDEALVEYREADEKFEGISISLEGARVNVESANRKVRQLIASLPAADKAALAKEEDRIAELRQEVQNFINDRTQAEDEIAELLGILKQATERVREQLELNFRKRAKQFFAEEVRLVYAPRRDKIGQSGRAFEFPAFEIEMTSSATEGHFIRRVAEQVSLSQLEYLDLIFRMSLIETFSSDECSMVVDGPEGSIDAVFAERAGDLFSDFASEQYGKSLILACNVVEGGFLPNTLRAYSKYPDRKKRVINLIELGAPTAALVELHKEYEQKVTAILKSAAR